MAWSAQQHIDNETKLLDTFKERGLTIHTPDIDAFRRHAQAFYLTSEASKDWPEGLLEAINGL